MTPKRNTDQANLTPTPTPQGRVDDVRPHSRAAKGAATRQRHKEAQRTDRLDQMRAQVDLGTLVIRQMTVAEHKTAQQAARDALAQTDARTKVNRALHKNRRVIG
jgi:hypothetical protein